MMAGDPPSSDSFKEKSLKKRSALRTINYLYTISHHACHVTLAANINKGAVTNKEKHTVRVGGGLKETVCSKCSVLLVPGSSARVRVRNRAGSSVRVVTCLTCGALRRYLNGGKVLHVEKCRLVKV